MKNRRKTEKPILFTLLFFIVTIASQAQSSLHVLEDESLYPVYEFKGRTPYCFIGDSLQKGNPKALTMLAAPDFGEGYLEVEILENSRGGVVNNDDVLRFVSKKAWFTFNAKVTASQDIDDAYYVMRMDKLGEAAYICRSLGPLKAGKSQLIRIFVQVDFEMPRQLHFYSGTEEIRTNLVPSDYTYHYGDFMLASN